METREYENPIMNRDKRIAVAAFCVGGLFALSQTHPAAFIGSLLFGSVAAYMLIDLASRPFLS